jgi:long-chain acyl-CoA synthetase
MVTLDLAPSTATALIDAGSGARLSYTDLIEAGRSSVAPLGPTKSLLFLLCRNDAFTATAYAGCLLADHAVALLDAGQSDASIADLVRAYRPPWLAGPSGSGERLAAQGVTVSEVREQPGGELVRLDGPAPAIHPDLCVLLSTSGTTGSRKLVRLSSRNIGSNASAIAAYLELTPDERPVSSLPLHYTFGLSVLDSHWLAGAGVVLTTESLVQGAFWDVVREHACTSLAGVPYTYLMLERIGFRRMDLPSLRTLQQAGGALDRRLTATYAEHMAARGGRLFVMYGQTEATARMAYVPPARLPEKLGSAGIAIPGGRLRIERDGGVPGEGGNDDEHDRVAAEDVDRDPASVVGEVVYQGPNVMLGYASGPDDLSRGDELKGVLHTGDLGYLDGEGFLYLVGRSTRIAKVFGLRLNLDEVEAVFREHGPAAVVGAGDAIWAFCAFGTDESLHELRTSLASRYRLHRSALHVQRVEAIPTAASGKVDYAVVRAWLPGDT